MKTQHSSQRQKDTRKIYDQNKEIDGSSGILQKTMESPIETWMMPTNQEGMLDMQGSVAVSICISSTWTLGCEPTASSKQLLPSLKKILRPTKIITESRSSSNDPKTKLRKVNSVVKPYASVQVNNLFQRKYPSILHREIRTGKKLFRCIICGEVFSNKFTLYQHRRSHDDQNYLLSESKPSVCEKTPQPTEISRKSDCSTDASNLEKSVGYGFKCDKCRKVFTEQYALKEHLRLQSEEKTFQCTVSNKMLGDKQNLKRHMLSHNGEKLHQCNVCMKAFSQMGRLLRHIRIHTGEKPFTCEICFKSFSDTSVLRRHRRVHTGEEPYECEMCMKTFTQKSSLKEHSRVHTGEKPFTCDVCNKTFSQKGNLETHSHIHTGEKPFICEMCNRGFSNSSYLQRHRRSHTGEKPYECDVCKKAFSFQFYLTKHKQTIHKM